MTFDFFLTSGFISIYCVGIVVFFVVCYLRLRLEARPLRSKLKHCKSETEEIDETTGFADVEMFKRYNEKMEKAFPVPWKEFAETLVLPKEGSGKPYRNTQPVTHYLNDASIIFPKIAFDFYRSVPNLLTGFGILGTFLGLAFGVGAASVGLTSGDPQQVTESLQQLLGGASLAFVTSVFGIAFSMVFGFIERRVSRNLHLDVDNWVKAVEARVERVTSEGIAIDQEEVARRQEQIARQREKVARRQLDQAERTTKQLERFNTELIFSLEKALEEKIAGRLSPQLDRLVEAVQGLRADRSSDAGDMIAQVLSQFTNAMQERTGSEFDEMAAIISGLNRTLRDATDGMARSQRDIRTVLDQVVSSVKASMDDGASAMTETLQQSLRDVTREIASASAKLAEQLTSSSNTAATELQETVGAATDNLANTAADAASSITGSLHGLKSAAESLDRSTQQSQRVLAHITTFVDQVDTLGATIEMAHRQIANVTAPVARAAAEIEAASDRTASALTQTSRLVDRIDTSVRALEQHQDDVAKAWIRYQERFEGIDDSLAKVFGQIDEGLSGYCEQVKKFANELDRTTSKTIQELAGATHELGQSIEDLTEHLGR